jgi:hypothetical protein
VTGQGCECQDIECPVCIFCADLSGSLAGFHSDGIPGNCDSQPKWFDDWLQVCICAYNCFCFLAPGHDRERRRLMSICDSKYFPDPTKVPTEKVIRLLRELRDKLPHTQEEHRCSYDKCFEKLEEAIMRFEQYDEGIDESVYAKYCEDWEKTPWKAPDIPQAPVPSLFHNDLDGTFVNPGPARRKPSHKSRKGHPYSHHYTRSKAKTSCVTRSMTRLSRSLNN